MPTTEYTFFASVPRNLERLAAAELSALGAADVKAVASGVQFRGALSMGYRACLWSRVANRVLLPLHSAPARSPEQLYEVVQSIDWAQHLDETQTIAVDFFCAKSEITHSHYGALKVKDAIVDQFRDRTGVRPSVDREQPDIRVNVYLFRNRARLSLDLSGESLHRRGYRPSSAAAPLKENLAAALLLAAKWDAANEGLFDPMCGSGTLLVEAAMIAADRAPCLTRDYFGFLGWKQHDAASWDALLNEARQRFASGLQVMPPLHGQDKSAQAIQAAHESVRSAGFLEHITLAIVDVHDADVRGLPTAPSGTNTVAQHATQNPIQNPIQNQAQTPIQTLAQTPGSGAHLTDAATGSPKTGLVISNPPYGIRVEEQATLGPLYGALGQMLRRSFGGWRVALLSGTPKLLHRTRLSLDTALDFDNGGLPVRLSIGEVPSGAVNKAQSDIGQSETPAPDAVGDTPQSIADTSPWAAAQQRKSQHAGIADVAGPDAMFGNRVTKNLKKYKSWCKRESIQAFRVYDADIPEFAVAVDIYDSDERHLVVQEYRAPATVDALRAAQRLDAVVATLPTVLNTLPENVHVKVRQRQKGTEQYEKAGGSGVEHIVEEAGCRVLVNFDDYLDTGLFLDHRKVRCYIQDNARDKRFLNLFGYTGAATAHAIVGGASQSVTVDMSRTYLAWAERNMALNIKDSVPQASSGTKAATHLTHRADCLAWLADPLTVGGLDPEARFDLILLDPPTFSNSNSMSQDWDVQRDHVDVIDQAMRLLANDGLLIFSNNYRRFKLNSDALSAYALDDRTRWSIDQDFQRNTRIHQCWFIRHKETKA